MCECVSDIAIIWHAPRKVFPQSRMFRVTTKVFHIHECFAFIRKYSALPSIFVQCTNLSSLVSPTQRQTTKQKKNKKKTQQQHAHSTRALNAITIQTHGNSCRHTHTYTHTQHPQHTTYNIHTYIHHTYIHHTYIHSTYIAWLLH